MDVSIAVSLIRGQMGSVVERAVNGAVETVLAEMLKVVGVKFEELKTQLALMKRDVTALQREKALKEKENDNIRAKLRYTELKLKYYRQGVEEELQQRASASTLVRIHPSSFPQTQADAAGLSSTDTSPSCSTQNRTTEGALMRCNQESTLPHSTSRRAFRVRCQSDARGASSDSSDLLLPVSLSENTPAESLDSSTEQEAVERVNDFLAPPTVQTVTLTLGKKSATRPLCPHGSVQAVSSTLPFSAPQSWSSPVVMQVKQEAQQQRQQGEEEGVICIKEEPEEEQQVMATLGLDYQVQQRLSGSEGQSSVTELQPSQATKTTAFSSAGTSNYLMLQPIGSLPSMVTLPSGIPPLQEGRPWSKNLSFYEQYKLRRNELQQRRLNRRREQEETLPQPLLADMLRERREKTRLRVARWRAKRKLQFCLNQTQGQGGAAGLSQPFVPIRSKHQEGRESCASSSGHHRLSSTLPQSSSFLDNNVSVTNTITTALPFITSISSSSLLPGSSIMAAHQHTVTSTSSSSSYPQISQSFSLTDVDILQ
ncbi:uncharacterized protein si:ch211-67e16.4 isoform X1 [Hippoglossus hippoglossus]|uniref:uncharacterized protein si:ch211-67e16.4 isoform X1 n=1 Tax=Hippoglossus hippoglossus TaxID=8267 RepID=UPI00148CAF99|nr:uncharacterized protein si:ch211-67e16.4 isoform X1 [Hippoglossus hippoglossus]